MKRRISLLALVALGTGMAGTALAAKQEDPFSVPRAQITATVKTIGVMPLTVAEIVPNAPEVAARYESAVVRRLADAGFQVVPPAAMREIRDRVRQSLGGLYNPMDGKPIGEKLAQYDQGTHQAYEAEHPVDALLNIAIDVRRAETDYNVAEWDGVKENITGKHGFATLLGGGTVNGTTPALSFVVTLRDRSGHSLYSKAGGLQLLHYVYVGYFGTTQRDVDPHLILSDPQRDARAIAIALGPLAGGDNPEATEKVAQASAAAPSAPAEVPEPSGAALVSRFPRLLLVPVQMPEIPQRAAVQHRLADALQGKLEALGFAVVRADDYDSRWKAERERVGGFFDPSTGRLDTRKVSASRVAVVAEIAQGRAVQAVVYPSVAIRPAQFAQGDASWDGVRERAFIARSALGGIFNTAKTLVGTLAAASLHVRIAGIDDVTLLDDYGGLQLTEKVDHGTSASVPLAELFTDASHDAKAIEIALQELSPPPKDK